MERNGVDLFNGFYKDKRILITGHTGFKGSWLSIWLNELGAEVVGYGLESYTKNDNFIATKLKDKIIDIRQDIRDCEKLQEVFTKYKPEIVFHLAAQTIVRLSYEIPKETYDVNVMGTLNVLECIRNTDSVKVGVMVTTDKCYENREQIWPYRESDPLGGFDPYSSSKGCAEILIASYRNSFLNPKNYDKHGKSIASVRAGNVIGGGDWSKDRIVPDCVRALMTKVNIEVRNPNSVRPWQHVLEPLSGYLLLGAKMFQDGERYCEGWNFGPEHHSIVKVEEVINTIIKYWGDGNWVNSSSNEGVHEAKLLSLDICKVKTYLNWAPVWDINKCIQMTVAWYRGFSEHCSMYEFCTEQIRSYQKCVNDLGGY
jgi:CDP-glucose 4,6-dehydratase